MDAATNVLLTDWDGPFGMPPFEAIRAGDFRPAFESAMRAHRNELDRIATTEQPADFENTIAEFDAAGEFLHRLDAVFACLTVSATTSALQEVQRAMAGPLARHWSGVYQDESLFSRVDAVHAARHVQPLLPEQRRLVERIHHDFVRAGARLAGAQRTRFAEIMQRLAELTTRFGQNVLHDESTWTLPLADAAAMAGLPESVRTAARQAGTDRGLPVPVITLSRSLVVPFLTFSSRRDLRQQVWRAWVSRGEHDGSHDNRPVALEILRLRHEQALLLGHPHYAALNLSDTMAGQPERVWALLDKVWQRARSVLEGERALLDDAMREEAGGETVGVLQAWDWRWWAERVRVRRFALDDSELKAYFALPAMVAAAFDCAGRLFGLRFEPRVDVKAYHPDVAAYEVFDASGATIGFFLHDNFSRPGKRSGAWMSALSWQHRNARHGRPTALPVILNNNNFAKAPAGQPALLSLDDVRTLFHEFGHALHGLLSDVGYRRLSGTQVLRDFVELPSQLFEHWALQPQVLKRHARHHQTGEVIPDALIARIEAARTFGSAYDTLRYTASAIVDMAAHQSTVPIDDLVAFEARVMSERGLPAEVGMNHRLPHFQHLFAGSGYAAGYYVYLWAEVLDADAFEAFVEAGDCFDAEVAARLRDCILSRGDSVEPAEAYRAFRGRDARLEPMLRDRGLIGP